ncbi:MAG: TrkH family potassium uptake protein [Candidatus Thermoplasmatota archaeon]|nr:TrkH family potassium uptake protein [Candidatus Thermoplasmatota archaeon]
MNHLKIICRDLGIILIIVGVVNLFSLIVPLIFKEYYAFPYIILTSVILVAVGLLLRLNGKKAGETQLRHAVVIAGLSWIIIPLITMIPFKFIGNLDTLSAFFESMSGWTTTGLTMFGGMEEELPHTIQFYRSFTQWIGGIGVVLLTVSILPRPGTGSYFLFVSEARQDKIWPSVVSTIRSMWWIYIFYTVLGIILLSIFGMPLWDAANHSMCAISTGGFATIGGSIGGYENLYLEIIVLLLMGLGATAFVAHHKLLRGKLKQFFGDIQVRSFIVLVIFGGVLLTLFNLSYYDGSLLTSSRYSFFQFLSSQSTTGFSTAGIIDWSINSKLLISFAMIIGGAAGATCGGIKLYRFAFLTKSISWRTKRAISSPKRVVAYKIDGKDISPKDQLDVTNEATIIIFLWVLCLIIGAFVLGFTNPSSPLENTFFEVCSAQGNVGMSLGITNISMNPIAKGMMIINMYIGRLEIIPVIMMIAAIFRRH